MEDKQVVIKEGTDISYVKVGLAAGIGTLVVSTVAATVGGIICKGVLKKNLKNMADCFTEEI